MKDYENYIARLSSVQTFFLQSIELMRLGLQTGFLPSQAVLHGINKSLLPHIVEDASSSAFYRPLSKFHRRLI